MYFTKISGLFARKIANIYNDKQFKWRIIASGGSRILDSKLHVNYLTSFVLLSICYLTSYHSAYKPDDIKPRFCFANPLKSSHVIGMFHCLFVVSEILAARTVSIPSLNLFRYIYKVMQGLYSINSIYIIIKYIQNFWSIYSSMIVQLQA